jgi:hypothetical protein
MLISLVILLMLMAMAVQEPPLEEFVAYESIIESIPGDHQNEQDIKKLLVAEHFRKAAMAEWQVQENRWLYLRNYNEAKRLMKVALSIAEEVSSERASTTSVYPASAPPANLAGASSAKGSSRK